MAKTPLNKKNLAALGADRLADLLLEVIAGNGAAQRRVRMELSAEAGADEIARDIRKRFVALRRATGFLDAKRRRVLAKELGDLVEVIRSRIAPVAPDEGFDLLWAFLHLADGVHARTDDSSGTIGGIFLTAMEAIEALAPQLTVAPQTLAGMVFDALQDNGYGAFDDAIAALSAALGPQGLAHLKALAVTAQSAPLSQELLDRYDYVGGRKDRHALALESRNRTADHILQDVADLQGDVDAYMARYSAEQLTYHTIAPSVAERLLAAGRADEALAMVEAARAKYDGRGWDVSPELDQAYVACLEALGRDAQAQAFLWQDFCDRLNGDSLRRHLKSLPDFEDIEAEERAKAIALAHPDSSAALRFLLGWPDLATAARLIETRFDALDGNAYYDLAPAADMLEANHPLAATLARRVMILETLAKARSKRYAYAAQHLTQCAALAPAISDFQGHADHAEFVRALRMAYPRNIGFWQRL